MGVGNIVVIRKFEEAPEGFLRVDVTSNNPKLKSYLSPFYLGPIKAYDGLESKTMENLWQFSKVYADMVDANGNPTAQYYEWRRQGFENPKAIRHPHKGKPLYNYWNGEKLGYIESRMKVYIPAYATCILNRPEAFNIIRDGYLEGKNIALADYDGYNFKRMGMSYEEMMLNPDKIMGHGHVLAMMIERPDIVNELLYNSVYRR